MTLAMPDSIRAGDLPPGYPAYLGYEDGRYITAPALAARFPAARRFILTVTGTHLTADGADVETGDLSPAGGALWAARKLAADPAARPGLYASVARMPDVLGALADRGIGRPRVRLLSAHWGEGEHICGPWTCKLVGTAMDGTQWTDEFSTTVGGFVDMSVLRDDFFGNTTETEAWVQQLGTVQAGDTGDAVRTVQGLCNARGFMGVAIRQVAIDGVFGPQTFQAVQAGQAHAGITVDGIVGPRTWPVLLGIN